MDQGETDTTDRAQRAWVVGLIQLVFVFAVIGGAVGLSRALAIQGAERAPQIADLRAPSEINVRLAELQFLSFNPVVRANGTVQSNAEIAVTPQVSGEIRRVSPAFRAGAELARGDFLFEIDRADYVLAVQRAEAEIAAARSDLQQLEAEAELARQEWQELYPGREINPLAARLPQIEAAKARLGSAEANKRTAELSLERTRVFAPQSSRVLASTLDIGQIVSPGQTVGRLVALESIEVAMPVSLDQLSVISPAVGRQAEFQRRGDISQTYQAEIVRVDASLDARTRLANIYLTPTDPADLRIGDFVDVVVEAETVDGAVQVPATALDGQSSVWVVENGQLASRDIVVLGEQDDGMGIIVAPFEFADGVVAVPPLEAEPGQPVGIRSSDARTASAGGRVDGAQ